MTKNTKDNAALVSRLKNLLTTNDRRRTKRDLKAGRRVNIYALSIEFEAADHVTDALSFTNAFTPTGPNNTIARKLFPGELDVKRGSWIKTPATTPEIRYENSNGETEGENYL